jgi:molybdopterin-synthase adenylyltransferase
MTNYHIQKNISDQDILDRSLKSGRSVQKEALGAMEAGEVLMRYQRNAQTITITDQILLARSTVLIVGCGGLGGYLCEYLVRVGIGKIVVCDPDKFEVSNFNRQVLATNATMGISKAQAARDRALEINPLVEVEAVYGPVEPELLSGVDGVADCLGGRDHRWELQEQAKIAGIPLVSAAISGWHALVCTTWPGENGLGEFLKGSGESAANEQGMICPAASFAASLQAAELIQMLTSGKTALRDSLLVADLSKMKFSIVDLSTNEV